MNLIVAVEEIIKRNIAQMIDIFYEIDLCVLR
jgi:hypothetical protein